MNNKRSSSAKYIEQIKNKKEILQDLNERQKIHIDSKIEETPILKLGHIKPEGIILEIQAREAT